MVDPTITRPLANYHSSVWGDYFLSYTPQLTMCSKKFTSDDGKFKETLTKDVPGLLSLYEAAHLRVHGEEILEEALTFTITHLKSMGPKLDNPLKAQVSEALIQPIHTNVPRVVARKYIRIYETIESHDDLLLKFAKLDFHILQKMHQRELSELTRWWKNLDHENKYPYARDKLVECYFWAMGMSFGPQYGHARRTITKIMVIITITNDLYDAYATYDELVPYTDAVESTNNKGNMDLHSLNVT
ncbi:hypothetical protein AABB24_016537 [Solanum stoloniferum]|uniref:Uncharacterized protein n=1 Tax=Solanum stoloniferum TaxID=62892 RepID=A0ABD2TUZ1_9SOLN